MPERPQDVLYTAPAVVEGEREGHARSLDGRLDMDLPVPGAMAGSGGPGHQTRRSCSPSASPWPPSCGSAGRLVTYAPTLSDDSQNPA
jgi:hypothetical protein